MAEIISRPKRSKPVKIPDKKCRCCKCVIRFSIAETWTEFGNTYGRCPNCEASVFLGRLGLKDS